ncbi:MAG: helix-turn-helix domain-containing protein [Actinobacteria bacterium]|nr:helix-turn-helix domain-containing protein [Actinomycetota bacterium]
MYDYGERLGRLSAAMADSTRRRIFEFLRESDSPLSARQVAEHFGLHVNAARIHLDKLAASGLVRVVRRRGHLGGRPTHYYQMDEGVGEIHFPPRHYRLLAEILAGTLAGMSDRSRRAAIEEARRRARLQALEDSSPLLRVQVQDLRLLARAWEEDLGNRGLKGRTRVTEEGGVEAVFLSCPFGELPRTVGELICDIHAALEEGRLGLAGKWCLDRGDRCTFTVHPPRDHPPA